MNTEFRTRLRVKQWKLPDILKKLNELQPAPHYPLPHPVYPWPTNICARCGMKREGAMGYCCPEGQMCGIPRQMSPGGWPPNIMAGSYSSAGSTMKGDLWN